jgi:hypothetical protein
MDKAAIRAAIAADAALQALVPNTKAIADALSVGRTRVVPTEVGNGTILEVLGLSTGNALLDLINTNPDFRYVKPLVEQGRLRLDSALVQATLAGLVAAAVITQAQADALTALCKQADPVSAEEVQAAIFNDNGSLAI